jgi:multidrug efflux pump subunit AcrB
MVASWAWGFTLNRVSLFALIFSIGILVDDAIVVVENIHRRMGLDHDGLEAIIPRAVDEVGGPTILATFTVIAALLPMAFVTGLMGPYMSPIPINASIGMVISLAIAFVVTPWLALKLIKQAAHGAHAAGDNKLTTLFRIRMTPFLRGIEGKGARKKLWLGIGVAILLSVALPAVKLVILKMLPFDNKSEFQVVVDLPVGTPLEKTAQVLAEMGEAVAQVPEVTDYQAYAGTAAPINFNGLVRQYYLRSGPEVGDLQGRRGAAGAAGAVADRRRSLRTRLRRADPGRQAGAQDLRAIRRHRRDRRHSRGRRPALRGARVAEQGGDGGGGAEGHRRGDEDGAVRRERHPHPRQRLQV